MGVLEDFWSVFARWQTWMLMANQDIGMRYRRSILGPFWISAAMAVLILGVGLLYAEIQHQPFKEFLTYLACGMVAWTFLTSLVGEGCNLVNESEGHLRNLPLPIPLLSARVVYRNFIILLHNAIVVGLMLAVFGRLPHLEGLAAIPGILVFVPIGLFFGIAFGPICARFRDLPQMVATMMQLAFFLTPVFWKPGANMDRHVALTINPFYHLLEIVRAPLLGHPATALNWYVALSVLATLGLLAILSLAVTRKRVFIWL